IAMLRQFSTASTSAQNSGAKRSQSSAKQNGRCGGMQLGLQAQGSGTVDSPLTPTTCGAVGSDVSLNTSVAVLSSGEAPRTNVDSDHSPSRITDSRCDNGPPPSFSIEEQPALDKAVKKTTDNIWVHLLMCWNPFQLEWKQRS